MKKWLWHLLWVGLLLTGAAAKAQDDGEDRSQNQKEFACLQVVSEQSLQLQAKLAALAPAIGSAAPAALPPLTDALTALTDAHKAGSDALAARSLPALFAFKYAVFKLKITIARSVLTRCKTAAGDVLSPAAPEMLALEKVVLELDNIIAAINAAA